MFCKINLHEIKCKIRGEYIREREIKVLISPHSAHQWQPYLIPETHDMYVIKEQKNIVLKDKDNLSSVGTNRPPNH